MKKLLLIIDGERQEIPVYAFEIAYNKYEEFDTVILIDTIPHDVTEEIVTVADVNKPSYKGILSWDPKIAESFKLSDFYTSDPASNPLIEARISNNVVVRDTDDIIPKEDFINHNLVVSSDFFNDDGNIFGMLDLIPGACNKLAEREKVAIGDHNLYIVEEPYVKLDEENKYRIIEKISVVRKGVSMAPVGSSDKKP